MPSTQFLVSPRQASGLIGVQIRRSETNLYKENASTTARYLSSKSGKYSWEVLFLAWYGALFQIGVQIGKQADDSVFGVGCWGELRASPCSLCSRPPSRSEGGESLSPAPAAVESLVSAEVSKRFLGVEHHPDVMFGGVVFGESVG